ncbi:MAG: conjugative transposon protein TraM [Bacteroidota bacterium]
MKKINFKQPKYVLPLILLPFLFFANYMYGKYSKDDNGPVAVSYNGINSSIPEPILKKNHDKDKTAAFKDNLNKKREYSLVNDVGEEEIQKITIEDNLTDAEKRKLDSLQKVIKRDEKRARNATDVLKKKNFGQPSFRDTKKVASSSKSFNERKQSRTQAKKSQKEEELDMFKEQMRILDSIQNPGRYIAEEFDVPTLEKEEPVAKLSKTKNTTSSIFKTITANTEDTFMTAMLDEGVKVWQGSRVKIRLTQDLFINDVLLEKGKYLYGTVTGFKTQRVEITINSIAVGDEVVPVEISLYDNDGIKGLYVPDSQFREFVKDLGVESSRNAAQFTNGAGATTNQGTEALYRSLSTAVQSSSRALAKALKRNKARLKYNTKVLLINTENN